MYKIYDYTGTEIDNAPSFHMASRIVESADRNNVKAGPHYCKPA